MNDSETDIFQAAEGCTMFFVYAGFWGTLIFLAVGGLFSGSIIGMLAGGFIGIFAGFFMAIITGLIGSVIFWLFLALEMLIRKIF